ARSVAGEVSGPRTQHGLQARHVQRLRRHRVANGPYRRGHLHRHRDVRRVRDLCCHCAWQHGRLEEDVVRAPAGLPGNSRGGVVMETMPVRADAKRLETLHRLHESLLARPNEPASGNGVVTRYRHPVLTAAHTPIFWRYDLDPESNPFLMERMAINA